MHMFKIKSIIFVTIILCCMFSFISFNYKESEVNQSYTLNRTIFQTACKMPDLPVNSKEMMRFVKNVKKIDCSKGSKDWVNCVETHCYINDELRLENCDIKCNFTDVLRVNDHKNKLSEKFVTGKSYELKSSDVVHVKCLRGNESWSNVLTGIRNDKLIINNSNWKKLPVNALGMNILMFGFDSISRNTFIRQLPKSYEYLTRVLKADILKGYNIVGDGTPQALIPILTGQTERELPETRKRKKFAKYVNTYPFIWNDFKKAGYVTAYFEDLPDTGIFTYRLNGFKDVPTDHYMRPYYIETQHNAKKWPKYCAAGIPRHMVMLNLIKDFYKVYKENPTFLFGFHGELSHDDYNLVNAADDDVKKFLIDLNNSGSLNNTILIMMADHGHRFAEIRNTIQGKLEERLPFFSFTFPAWFKEKYSSAYQNFKHNLDKLTTPFDIYSTLKDVLELNYTGPANIEHRSVSLFTKIPPKRSCFHADVEPHWCACLDWQGIKVTNPVVDKLSNIVEKTLNNFTSQYRDICEELSVKTVHWVTRLKENINVLKYKKNSDLDGFEPDLTDKMIIVKEMFQLKVTTSPGDSLYEASVTHYLKDNSFVLAMSDISRINVYGNQARCVQDNLPDLRKYCYCKYD